jgi:nucleoside recognition membrane protein YjiH
MCRLRRQHRATTSPSSSPPFGGWRICLRAGAVVYAVSWWESVPRPVLTFGAIAAIAALMSPFEQTTEKDEVEGGNDMGIVWTILAIIGLVVVIAWLL